MFHGENLQSSMIVIESVQLFHDSLK